MKIQQNEQRMMWLMLLIVVAVGAWFLNQHFITYICGIAFVMSVMQYVDAIEVNAQHIQTQLLDPVRVTSKVPLYLASGVTIFGVVMDWSYVIASGVSVWIYFFLRWLQRLERTLIALQRIYKAQPPQLPNTAAMPFEALIEPSEPQYSYEPSLIEQFQTWLFKGNPVLKAAILILVIGVILLLRFAAEQWQLSLSVKLAAFAAVGATAVILGRYFISKNRSFAIAVQGLGFAILFLTLFFAYDERVIQSLWMAGGCFVIIQLINIVLSLKQDSRELAIMAIVVAFIAPFTVSDEALSTTQLLTYYLCINATVAVLSSLRPWKVLNQIAFLLTAMIASGYALIHFKTAETWPMTLLVTLHSLIFMWLALRFSQLKLKTEQVARPPLLDLGLIFAVPLTAFAALYLLHFQQSFWQALFSLMYAAIFFICWQWTKKTQHLSMIAQSYMSLMLIFISLIPPILLPEQWSVVGWAVEGVLIYGFALHIASKVSRYLAQALLVIAGLSSFYYLFEMNPTPTLIFWVLSCCYLVVVLVSQLTAQYRAQLCTGSILFLSLLSTFATCCLLYLIEDQLTSAYSHVLSLLIVTVAYVVLNEIAIRRGAEWTWLIPKWCAITPLLLIDIALLIDWYQTDVGFVWLSLSERLLFALACVLQAGLWCRPLRGVKAEKEWVSFGVAVSLSAASLTLWPAMPYFSVVILPLLFCLWCAKQSDEWTVFWQSKVSLLWMSVWMICSQLFSTHSFVAYAAPVINPFDAMSIAMLVGFIWMLRQQIQAGRDRGLVAVLMVVSLLWLSSYIVLRALHVYVGTPLNELAVWSNATIQLSLTALWVLLAALMMGYATRKVLKPVWILGGSILVLVSLKLVFFDLAHIGTLTRVLSFLIAGGVMLFIAYLAPMPESTET